MEPLTPESLAGVLRNALAGKYEIERRLGSGGMGSVFLGRDLTLDRPVAIKVINPDLGLSATVRQRFLQEARTIARLNHPNITDVYAAGEVDGLLYFIMEYVPGESLRELLDRERCCSPERAAAILRDLAAALAAAHKQGVIHRDIKPENVLLHGTTGEAKLTDFGVARAFRSEGERVTGTGMVVGTPRYMSPEQASGEREIDGRSDIYSLGLIGYEMFAGEPAFTGATPASVIMKQITERPAPLVDRVKNVPPDVAAVIERALEKNPTDRFADAGEMVRALSGDTAAISGPVTPTSTAGRRRARNRQRAIGGALALLAVAAVAWFAVGRSDVPDGVDPRKSFFVAPFENQTGDPGLAWLREGSVNMLSLNLATWRDLNVVEYERSLDLLRDAELDTVARIGLEDAREVARKAGVWTVVMGVITKNRDSLSVSARVYDVASGNRLQQATQSIPAGADPRVLFDRLSRDLLQLAGAPPMTPDLARTTTSSLEAYRSYLNGVRQLNDWKLDSAEASFAHAIRVDSTFALAYHKRAQGKGWRPVFGDSTPLVNARLAQKYADRLPERERALLNAYLSLAEGLRTGSARDTAAQRRSLVEAQQRYTALVRRDSSDVEAWYGLGDAYYHVPTQDLTTLLANWTHALRAFDRTLMLDSTFHLAYPHRIQIYTMASTQGSDVILVGDSLVGFKTAAEADAFGRPRILQARTAARDRVINDARRWVETDPDIPESHRALSDAYMAANRFGEAAAVLRQAVQRPELSGGELRYRLATLELLDHRPAQALETLREALRLNPADSLRKYHSTQVFPSVSGAAAVAAHAGVIRDMRAALEIAARVDKVLPFAQAPTRTKQIVDYLDAINQLALGVEFREVKRPLDVAIRQLDTYGLTPPPEIGQARNLGPFFAYVLGRDTTYLTWLRKWKQDVILTPLSVQALLALDRGDTATAQRLAAGFPRGDSAKARAAGPISMLGPYIEAEILATLGDLKGAVATYEALTPTRYLTYGYPDPRWPLYARSYLTRGRLYEQLGERAKADSAYTQFLRNWKEADGRLEPQLRSARDGLTRVRDAGPAEIKKSG